eukprot:15443872-Alexandrium_andersonii.AAC.1
MALLRPSLARGSSRGRFRRSASKVFWCSCGPAWPAGVRAGGSGGALAARLGPRVLAREVPGERARSVLAARPGPRELAWEAPGESAQSVLEFRPGPWELAWE